jgi:hypothetical protein
MPNAEPLLSFAEIAVTLAGFSGLIAAFRGQSLDEWHPRDLLILWLILGLGGLAMLFALLPFPLFQAGLSDSAVWRASSLAFLCLLLAGIGGALGASFRVARAGHPVRTPRVNAFAISVGGVSVVALAANGAWFTQPWIYSSVLVLLLCLSFLYLATFVFNVQSRGGE